MARSDASHRANSAISERDFSPEPASAPAARHFVIEVSRIEDAETLFRLSALTSELVSNAILHAGTAFRVSVSPRRKGIRVSVTDGSTFPPVPQSLGPEHPTGRGLRIVEALADQWGVSPDSGGKTVWFELRRPVA